ncbi:MAG: branched-chain amino acid transport system permease protein [Nocardioidaceae bacterium]|jgi:branched-chain amino acid transport system permease protein|nr:branched-chain amino acid transport system permease protein [Nocardioidaceae bacterium]
MTLLLNTGLPLVGIYGILAIGYVVVYRSTGVLNFAHGGFMVLGGFLGYSMVKAGVVGVAVMALVVLVGLVVGWAFYRFLMRRMAGEEAWAPVLVTVGVGLFILVGVVQLIWSTHARQLDGNLGFANRSQDLIGGVSLSTMDLIVLLVFVFVWLGLLGFYRWSPLGIRMRAASQDHHLAAYRSINIDLLFGMVWALAVGLAMFAGFSYGVEFRFEPAMAVLALKAFPVALAGGMDSILGVGVAALVIGLGEAAVQIYIDSALAEVLPFFVLLLVLMARPWGLFGTPEVVDRV